VTPTGSFHVDLSPGVTTYSNSGFQNGSYEIAASIWQGAGQLGPISPLVSVTVGATPTPTPACAVSISSPANGATVSGSSVNVSLSESGCGGNVNRLEVVGATGSNHFDFTGINGTFDSTQFTNGSTTLSVTAWTAGYVAQIGGPSSPITVTISNAGATPTPTPTSTPTATPTSTPAPIFVGRTQSSSPAASTSVSITTPSGIQNGDMMVIGISDFNASIPFPAPGAWTALGQCNNSSPDFVAAFASVWTAGSATSYSFNNVTAPKVIIRVYRGPISVDGFVCAPQPPGTTASGNSFTIPQLPATLSANEQYVAEFFNDLVAIAHPPSDLGNGVTDPTQWFTFDGDKLIISPNTTPPAETGSN
jgi:hypothetical protein